MDTKFFEMVISQGAFAVLFVWLFMDTRKENKERESRYQETINKLADKIGVVEEIREDVQAIKDKMDIKKGE